MVLSEAIRDYLQYARCELGHSETTHLSYQSWLRRFARWLAETGAGDPLVTNLGAAQIRRFQYHLSSQRLRPRTIRGGLNALRGMFAYLHEMGLLPSNPALEVRLPKKDAATRLLVADDDLVALLDAAARQASDFRCVRDRAVLAVLIFCGLRRQELLDLRVQDVNLKDGLVLVHQGKGGKSRTVYLCEDALVALQEWMALRIGFKCHHQALFTTPDRRRLGEQSLPHLLEEIKAIAGLKGDPRIKPHSIRHAAATRLLRNGADIRSIQAWLGHSQLQTTAIYLHTDEEHVRKIAPLAAFAKPQDAAPAGPHPAESERRFTRTARTRNWRARA